MRIGDLNISDCKLGVEQIIEVRHGEDLIWPDTPPTTLTIDPETYEQDEKARSFDIAVDSDSNWTAASSEPWLTLSATSGSSGTSVITASLLVNDTGALRTAEITITNSDETKVCNVTQNTVQ